MSNMGKLFAAVVVILVIGGVAMLLMQKADVEPTSTEPIKIGFIAPLSGDAAAYGEPVKRGVEIAVEEINADGGVDGRMLEVIYEDGRCDNKDATSAAQKLISIDGVKVIVGMICSGEVLSAAPVAESAHVILIGQGTSPDITAAGDYVFRTMPSDTGVGTALAAHIVKSNFKKVALLSGSTAYTVAMKNNVQATIESTDLEIVASEDYVEGVKDYRALLQKIKTTNPDVLIINTQVGSEAAIVAQQARDLGITAQFYTAYFSGPEFVEMGEAVEGTYVVDAPAIDDSNTAATAFLQKSEARYGTPATYPFFSTNAYDQVYLLADIFARVGADDVEKMKEALYKTKNFKGLSGTFGFDANGDVTGITMRVTQIKDGKLVPAN